MHPQPNITRFFPSILWCLRSKYSLMSLLRPICLSSCFQFPLSLSPLYPWWHYHLLAVPQEPLHNCESGCNVPFKRSTNVGVISALPTGSDQSASSRAHYGPLLPHPHLSVFIPTFNRVPLFQWAQTQTLSVCTVRRTLSGRTEALQDFKPWNGLQMWWSACSKWLQLFASPACDTSKQLHHNYLLLSQP